MGRILAALLLLCEIAAPSHPARAAWPERPLRIFVIAAPGGLPDTTGRIVAAALSAALGQPVTVENRPGGGGNIASAFVARAVPDGYSLLMTGNNQAVNPTLLPNPGFNYDRDLTPVSLVAEANMLLVASPALAITNLRELQQLMHDGREVSIAVSPIGTPNHLGAELLAQMLRADFAFAVYNGIGPAIPDLMSGRVDLAISAIPSVLPLVENGSLRGLAVSRAQRSPLAPNIPTAAESGLPGFEVNAWVCLMTTGGTPAAIVQRLSEEVRKAVSSPEIQTAFAKQGVDPRASTPEELGAYIAAEADKWRQVLKFAKLKQ